jgi:CxxC motif-containing protein (DUF1111 family)
MTIRARQIVAGIAVIAAVTLSGNRVASAVSPAAIELGRQLFERDWQVGNPSIGSDGLGPLFNARSCVACHHQGGVGGGGDSRFNAKTLGIEELKIVGGAVDDAVVAKMVRSFHPGFIAPGGTITNTLPIAHHGGSPLFVEARKAMLSNVPAVFSEFGGPENAEETRRSYATPILFNNRIGKHRMTLRARLFHRNTTSLFGSGLIDLVSDSDLDAQVRAQKSHPEISGRPSVLDTGDYGKFGWRANVRSLLAFNDQACANEVGLETRRKPQPRDPMNPAYRNPAIDIHDNQIRTLTTFVAALPAPVRQAPDDSDLRAQAERGEYLFASLDCAVCHVPSMGPAQGVYSDLLLHDMGYESIDLNHAEPYRVAATPVRFVSTTMTTTTQRDMNTTGYYGGSSTMTTQSTQTTGLSRRDDGRVRRGSNVYTFVAPTVPGPMKVIPLGSTTEAFPAEVSTDEQEVDDQFARGRRTGTIRTTSSKTGQRTIRDMIRVHYEPTNFNQEWRTPPLWGVRDSAPYMHDGRAGTLLEAITMHEGEGAGTRDRFLNLSLADRHDMIAFLETLIAPANVPQPRL